MSLLTTGLTQIGHMLFFPPQRDVLHVLHPFAELLDLMPQELGIPHGHIPDVESIFEVLWV